MSIGHTRRLAVVCFLALLVSLPVLAAPKTKKAKVTPADQPAILLKLIVDINADPISGPAPLKVQFFADVYDAEELKDLKVEWDFGDGSPKVRGIKATHTFKKPDTYVVVAMARAAGGRSGRDELNLEVEAPQ